MPALLPVARRRTSGVTRQRLLRELAEVLEVWTAKQPLILWLQDLQWCDPSTTAMLAYVARRTVALPQVAMDVPTSLRRLVTQQLEALSSSMQMLLEAASVAGMAFSAAEVAAATGRDVSDIETLRARLARRGQLLHSPGAVRWPDGTVTAGYRFLHQCYHDVLYQRVPAGQCRQWHQRIGMRLERAFGTPADDLAARLAMHFDRGHDYARAVRYLRHAGENAARRGAPAWRLSTYSAA
jgi:predicted ATPase